MCNKAVVYISRVKDPADERSIENAVREAVTGACDFAGLCKSKQVVIKPNVYCPSPAPVTTDPRVVASLIRLAKDSGAREVVVAEGRSISTALFRSHARTTRACFEAVGMDKVALDNGARIVYLEEDELLLLRRPDAVVLKEARIMRTVYEADVLINVPVLKNHSLTLTTLGIKNLHGILSDDDKLFGHDYRHIPNKLVDILRYVKPHLTVIDGVRGQEADHADMGRTVETGVIIAGTDVTAVDAVGEAVMGLSNLEVDTTRLAHEQGLGIGDRRLIKIIGASLDTVQQTFARPDIEISEQRFPGLRIRAGDYCKGCEYYIRRGIDRLAAADLLDPGNKLTLVFGKNPNVEENLDGRVIIIGDCALESESVKRLRNRLWLNGRLKVIYSCPPMEFRMRALELAGD
ncbi:MAG: DUF362 domain-containing protein [Armatimonadota bacterium]|nr:DUF362 domain-containing protein [Armatimonadota bacterium]